MSLTEGPSPGSPAVALGAAEAAGWMGVARTAARALGPEGESFVALRELLVFGLDRHAYAIAVPSVREIVRMKVLTRVPRAPAWLLGVVALRGEVVEVVDLRIRLGLGAATFGRTARIIVLHGDADRVTGIVVDSVSEVIRVREDEILPAPALDVNAVVEVCRRGDGFVSILDVDRTLGSADV